MAEVVHRVCDVCGNGPAKDYMLTERPNTPWVVDLCDPCAAPIKQWRDVARSGPSQRRAYRKFEKVEVTDVT